MYLLPVSCDIYDHVNVNVSGCYLCCKAKKKKKKEKKKERKKLVTSVSCAQCMTIF